MKAKMLSSLSFIEMPPRSNASMAAATLTAGCEKPAFLAKNSLSGQESRHLSSSNPEPRIGGDLGGNCVGLP